MPTPTPTPSTTPSEPYTIDRRGIIHGPGETEWDMEEPSPERIACALNATYAAGRSAANRELVEALNKIADGAYDNAHQPDIAAKIARAALKDFSSPTP